jgi:DNA-binding MarR family transcriptional regulator
MKKKSDSSLTRGQPPECLMNLKGFMLYKLGQFAQESFEKLFEGLPVQARHLCVIRVLLKTGSQTQQQLCDSVWIDRATMVGVIQLLGKMGFVKKTTHPEDRRSFLISVTAKGEQFYEKHWPDFQKMEKNLFPSLSRKELEQFESLLQKTMSELREI